MDATNTIKILQSLGALFQHGHYVYKSGEHGEDYIDKKMIIRSTRTISEICKALAIQIYTSFNKRGETVPFYVVGPGATGSVLSQWTTHHLIRSTNLQKEVESLFADKREDGSFELCPAYAELVQGQRVIVVEDIVNTGESARRVVEAIKDAKGVPQIVAAIWNRGNAIRGEVGTRDFLSLVTIRKPSYVPGPDRSGCSLCVAGTPINTDRGHGKKFLVEQALLQNKR